MQVFMQMLETRRKADESAEALEYAPRKSYSASILTDPSEWNSDTFQGFYEEQIRPLELDLALNESGFTRNFCDCLVERLESFDLSTLESARAWEKALLIDRWQFLQRAIVLIDVLSSRAPSRHFHQRVYQALSKSSASLFGLKSRARRPISTTGDDWRAYELKRRGYSWEEIADEILGSDHTEFDTDRLRQSVRRFERKFLNAFRHIE